MTKKNKLWHSKNRIKELRLKRNKTQKEVGEAIGLTDRAIAHYENGIREPKLETWQKLADFFGVSVSYLLGYRDSPNNNFDDIFLEETPYDIKEWNSLFDTNATKISTSLSTEQESNVVNSLETYKKILGSLIPYVIEEKLDTNEVEKIKKNNLKMLISIINTLDTDFWPESQISQATTWEDFENIDLRTQKKLNKILKEINELLKDELKK